MCRFSWIALFWGCFLSSVLEFTECVELSITVEQNTTIHIDTANTHSECKVCIIQDTQLLCQTSVVLKSDTLLNFSCSQPENVFTVHIITDIGQIETINIEPKEYPAFQKFNRTFSWNRKPLFTTQPYNLHFSNVGLRQISHTDSCPDKHIYKITTMQTNVGQFCQNGNIRQAYVRDFGTLSLEISGGQPLNSIVIGVAMESIITYDTVKLYVNILENGTQDVFSLNYPESSPSDTMVSWNITVPPLYYTSVHVLSYTIPTCLYSSSATVMYRWQNNDSQIMQLIDTYPVKKTGNLILTLRNCQILQHSALKGLKVHFKVFVLEKTKEHCSGYLSDNQALQIRVKREDPNSACVMKSGSDTLDTATIAAGRHYELYFFDCNKYELELSINQTIESKEWRNCTNTSLPLLYKPLCTNGIVKTVTWHLHGPEKSAVELRSPTSGFCHFLSEKNCNCDVLLNVSHINSGFTVGQFCLNGAIQSIQIQDSSIAVSFTNINDRRQMILPNINYLFRREISEDYIFTVDPKNHYPALLATPGWPSGMKPSYTVSWIVTLDSQLKSKVEFRNVSKPTCKERSTSTSITVQSIYTQETLYSTEKDGKIKNLPVLESFYLNMTNCKSPTGDFKAVMAITLQYSTIHKLLAIILGIVGILLVIIITAMVVRFILRRRRKSNKTPPVHFNKNAVLPGHHGIPAEDPHIYTYIDDTLTYFHILKTMNNQCEECTMDDSASPQSGPLLPDGPIIKVAAISEDMIDNELYGLTQLHQTHQRLPEQSETFSETIRKDGS